MAKAIDTSAPILTGTSGTESALSGIDLQSKAAFENALRAAGDTAYVEQYVQDNPEKFLSPYELSKLQDLGPDVFWSRYSGEKPTGSTVSGSTVTTGSTTPKQPIVFTASDGKTFTDQQAYVVYQQGLDQKKTAMKSAYDSLRTDFKTLGLDSLIGPIEDMIQRGVTSGAELMNELRATTAYKNRFAANEERIKNGYRALSEAEYIQKENAYRKVMQMYGIPQSYYTSGVLGKTEAFEKLLAGDVSSDELQSRIQEGLTKVMNANPEVLASLRAFFPELKTGDVLAYVLDPKNAIQDIQRQVSAAQIGGAALSAGLLGKTPEEIAKSLPEFAARAKELVGYGVTGQQYGEASPFISSAAERGGQLASIYNEAAYGRTQAEAEALKIGGSTEARKQREKLTALEKASFSGSSGMAQDQVYRNTAISRDRAGAY